MAGSGFAFDPTAQGSYGYKVAVYTAAGGLVAGSGVTIDVPEPGSLALAGLALMAAAVVRRRT